MKLSDFRDVWVADFEYSVRPGERPRPVCLVAHEFRSRRKVRLFGDALLSRDTAPYSLDTSSLFVSYSAPAELSCHLALGWPMPRQTLDLYAEFRWRTSGRRSEWPGGHSLLGALSYYGLPGAEAVQKQAMRDLALRGGPYSSEEERALLDYCETDVASTMSLFEVMAREFDLPRALLRGHYASAVAAMVHRGIPIDLPLYRELQRNWMAVKGRLIQEVDRRYGVFDGTTFKLERFLAFLKNAGISWPMTPSGRPCLDRETFKSQARLYPTLEDLRYLRDTLADLKNFALEVGADGRNRTSLFPFGTVTGRNAPSTTRFIFGLPAFLRSLIQPPPGYSVAYVDWSAQEIAIAAALSEDEAMLHAYRSGDPHLAFAVQAGLAPKGASKGSHPREREQAKGCNFGVLYGMGAAHLALRLGIPVVDAARLLELHRRSYPAFWRWVHGAVEYGFLHGRLFTVHGWQRHVTPETRRNQLQNFCVQGAGADMLRLACCLALDAGIPIIAPIHDALLVEAPTPEIERVVEQTREVMERASRLLLSHVTVRTEAKIVNYPDRYVDGRGAALWEKLMGILNEIRSAPPTDDS